METHKTLDAIPCCPNCGADDYGSALQRAMHAYRGGIDRARYSRKMCYMCRFHWREWNWEPAACKPPFKEHRS